MFVCATLAIKCTYEINNVMFETIVSKVFVWIGSDANEDEKREAVTSGEKFPIFNCNILQQFSLANNFSLSLSFLI